MITMRRIPNVIQLFLVNIMIFASTNYVLAQCNDDFTTSSPGCTNQNVNFFAVETDGASTYAWDFGDGNTSTLKNPSNTYNSAGAYNVTLTVSNPGGGGCSNTDNQDITINPSPTANFNITAISSLCVDWGINFDNTSSTISDTGITYTWDFGSGANPSSSTAKDPKGVNYSTVGPKTITLTVDDGNCKSTTTKSTTINATPTVSFSTTAPTCTGETVNFTNTGSTGDSYAWDFGDGSAIDTAQNPTNVYTTAGNKVVKLITTIGTCNDSSILAITIHQNPTSSFSVTGGTLCGNVGVDFTNDKVTTGDTWSYSWDFGQDADPASATSEDPKGILYNSSGSKLVTFTISDANCSDMSTQTVTISPTPTASFTSTAPACTEESVDFTNTGSTGAYWKHIWTTFGSGASSPSSTSEDPIDIIYSTDGIKSVTLVIVDTSDNCSDTSYQTINIHFKPTSSFSFTGGTLCGNVGVDFTNNKVTTGDNWSYSWDFGEDADPSDATSEDPKGILYNSNGSKLVTFTISDANCSDMSTQTVTISPTPTASFTSTTPACTEDSVDFTNTGSTGANWNYKWITFGSGASSPSDTIENPIDIIYSTEGIKSVTLVIIDDADICSDTSTQTININFRPNVNFTTSPVPVCVGAPINFTNNTGGTAGDTWSFNWDFGKDAVPPSSTAENPTGVKYYSGGSKTITFTISDANCTNTFTDAVTVSINSLPVADAGLDTIICANRSVMIGTTEDTTNSYSWWPATTLNNGAIAQPTASPEAEITVYHLTVTNKSTSCVNYDSVTVTMLTPISADAGEDAEICWSDSIQIGSALIEGQTYSWSPTKGLSNSTSPNPMVAPDSSTTYTVTVTAATCDAITDEVYIIVHPLPDANAGSDVTIARGSSTQLIATGGVMYGWFPGDGLNNISIFDPVATPDSTTSYIVTVTDVYDCVNTDTVIITVVEPTVWTPSAFTPNGDGRNDVFYARGEKSGIINFKFRIFNKWGDVVFYSEDIDIGWDGYKIVTREALPEGAYIYNVQGEKSTGENVNISGVVNLIR